MLKNKAEADEGLVVLGRGKITVKDKEKLKKYL